MTKAFGVEEAHKTTTQLVLQRILMLAFRTANSLSVNDPVLTLAMLPRHKLKH